MTGAGDPGPRVAVVTGGAQGIGAAIAAALLADGMTVAVLDRNAHTPALARELSPRALGVVADVTDATAVDAAFTSVEQELGSVTALVNNAGVNAYFDATTMTEDDWDRVFAVDLKAAWLCARRALPAMQRRRAGAILNVSSIHSLLTTAGMFPYAAAKAGLDGLTRSLALDVAPYDIRVNAVAPGWTRTALVDEFFARQDDPAQARRQVEEAHPLGRIATPHDIAAVAAFLLSDAARAMTGAVVRVDCGLSIKFGA